MRHRFDTMTLDVPYPDVGDIRDRVWAWIERATRYGDRDRAQAAQFQRHRAGLGVPLTPKDDRPQIEPERRQIVIWGDVISRHSDIWLRVQFCPHDPDHTKFIGHLAYQLDGHWGDARVSRLDLAMDSPGVLRDFVVFVDRVRKHQPEIEVVDGETFETWKIGHRGGVQYLRAYDRKRREVPERVVRFELEWKPAREDRPLVSALPATPFGLTRRALVARPHDVPLSPLDLTLISGIQDFGWTPLYRDETKPLRRRLRDLRRRLEAAEATFDLASEARVHWSYRLMCLREILRLDRAGVPDPRWLHPGT